MPGSPRVLDVAVMGVVPERAGGQLAHVQLAEGDGAGRRQPGHRRGVTLGDEVLGGRGAARRGEAADGEEVLVGERDAVERARRAGRARGLRVAPPRPPRALVGVHRDEGAQASVQALDRAPGSLGRPRRGDGAPHPGCRRRVCRARGIGRGLGLERREEARGLLGEPDIAGRPLDRRREVGQLGLLELAAVYISHTCRARVLTLGLDREPRGTASPAGSLPDPREENTMRRMRTVHRGSMLALAGPGPAVGSAGRGPEEDPRGGA